MDKEGYSLGLIISEAVNIWQKEKDIPGKGQENKGIKLGPQGESPQSQSRHSVWLTSHFSFVEGVGEVKRCKEKRRGCCQGSPQNPQLFGSFSRRHAWKCRAFYSHPPIALALSARILSHCLLIQECTAWNMLDTGPQ